VAPFRYICQIRATLSNGYVSVGTGFFVGPRTILTAAHNVWDEFVRSDGAQVPTDKVEIIPARNGERVKPYGSLTASRILLPDAHFKSDDRGKFKDYALILIDRAVGETTGYFTIGAWPEKGGESLSIHVAGYPGDKDPEKMYQSADSGARMARGGQFLTLQNDTAKGMSGGPVWMERPRESGGTAVAGFLLGPGDKDRSGRYLFNVARYIDKDINDFIAANRK
jgi:glutamyl endopeptidase